MKSSHFLALAAVLALSGTVSAAWTRLPSTEARPVNLATKSIPGTKIVSSKGLDNAGNLLSADPAVGVHVAAGKSEVTIHLVNQQVLEVVSFINDGMEGKITCAGSPDDKNWTTLGHATFSAGERVVPVTFAGAQAKYVNISFESAQGGSIRDLQVFGTSSARDFVLKPAPTGSGPNVNLAGGASGAHAIYVHPAPSSVGELDVRFNVFKFPNTGDKYRTVVYDLGASRTIREFSTAYSARPVRLDVFAFDVLPEKKDWRGKMTLDPVIFDQTRPVASAEDARGLGYIKIVPGKPVVAQYIALRFEPNYQRAATGAAFEASWGDFAQLTFGSAAPLLDVLNLLPQERLAAGDDGGFTIGDINAGSASFSTIPGSPGNEGQGGATGTGTGSTETSGVPPYLPGTPGSPAAGTGGLPGTGATGSTATTTPITAPNNVNVTVSGSGGGTTVNAGNPGNNNPGTTCP